MFDVELCASLPQALPGVVGKWERALAEESDNS